MPSFRLGMLVGDEGTNAGPDGAGADPPKILPKSNAGIWNEGN